MTKTIEAKPVREARAKARRLSKTTHDMTYQQALDHIARESGHPHWSAFVSSHPSGVDQASQAPRSQETLRSGSVTANYLRSLVTGRRAAEEDRMRAAAAIYEAEDFAGRKGLWAIVCLRMLAPGLVVLMMGAIQNAIGGLASTPWQGVLGFSGGLTAVNAVLFAFCLAIGDHPGMEHRRAQVWTATWWVYVSGFVLFMFGGLLENGLFGMTMGTTAMVIVTIGLFGDSLRDNLHTLMALGATLGPRAADGSSIADLSIVPEVKARGPRPEPLTPEMARELGRKKPWHQRIGIIEITGCVFGLACILAIIGAGLTLLGVKALAIGYAALVLLSPFILLSFGAGILYRLADIGHFTEGNGLGARIRRIRLQRKTGDR